MLFEPREQRFESAEMASTKAKSVRTHGDVLDQALVLRHVGQTEFSRQLAARRQRVSGGIDGPST